MIDQQLIRKIAEMETDIERLKTLEFLTRSTTPIWGRWRKAGPETVANSTAEVIVWATEDNDTDSMWTSGSEININTAGVVLIVAQVQWATNSSGRRRLEILRSGGVIARKGMPPVAATVTNQQCVGVHTFTAAQNVEINVRQNSGGNLDYINGQVVVARIG